MLSVQSQGAGQGVSGQAAGGHRPGGARAAKVPSREVGRGLQWRWLGREGAALSINSNLLYFLNPKQSFLLPILVKVLNN